MKHILLIITEVLTETLFAIHKQGKSLPNELYVIPTQSVKPLLVDGLFKQGYFQQLLTDYKLPEIEFSEKNIWLIEDQNGQPVFDASTEVDQKRGMMHLKGKVITTKDGRINTYKNAPKHEGWSAVNPRDYP